VEGLIHINSLLDDYYYYDEEKYELVGEQTGRKFKLGESVTIRVADTDKIRRIIDFELLDDEGDGQEEKTWQKNPENS
jgi:ribonuclease R